MRATNCTRRNSVNTTFEINASVTWKVNNLTCNIFWKYTVRITTDTGTNYKVAAADSERKKITCNALFLFCSSRARLSILPLASTVRLWSLWSWSFSFRHCACTTTTTTQLTTPTVSAGEQHSVKSTLSVLRWENFTLQRHVTVA